MVVADHYYGYYAYGWPLHSRQTLMVLLQWLWLLWSWLTTMVDHAMVMVDHVMVMVDHTMVMVDHYIHVKHWGINPSSMEFTHGSLIPNDRAQAEHSLIPCNWKPGFVSTIHNTLTKTQKSIVLTWSYRQAGWRLLLGVHGAGAKWSRA